MYSLEVTPRITKELLLSKEYTQETYFEHYLGVPVKKGLFVSPPIIRVDKKPTCAFYKNKQGILKYKDFAGPTFDFVGAVMYIYQVSYYKALRIIANDFGFLELENVPKNPPKIEYTKSILEQTEKAIIEVEIQDFTKKELSWWDTFGITLETLKKFKVFSIKSVFLNGHYYGSSTDRSPIYGYYGGTDIDGNELWRLYMPTRNSYRFLSNWSSTMIQGAKQLPKTGDFIIITKSLKDVMALYEFGITAIAPNSENLFLTENQFIKLSNKFKDIYLLYDRDLPGVRAAQKIRKQYNVKVLLVPKVKDFTDYIKKYGILKTLNLVNSWLEKRKK